MDLYSQTPFTQEALMLITRHYIPSHFQPEISKYSPQKLPLESMRQCDVRDSNNYVMVANDGVSNLQLLLDNDSMISGMYGSAQELAENLKIYSNFPLNHKKFGFSVSEPSNHSILIYESLRNEKFISKQDLLVMLERFVFQARPTGAHETIASMIMLILRDQEERLNVSCEFVRFDVQRLATVFGEFILRLPMESVPNFNKAMHPKLEQALSGDFYNFFEPFKQLLPKWTPEQMLEHQRVEHILHECYQRYCPRDRFLTMYNYVECFSRGFTNMVTMYRDLFRPLDKKITQNGLVAVRVFEDEHSGRFVMRSELFDASNFKNPLSRHHNFTPLEANDTDGMISTMSMEEVMKKYKSEFDYIELIIHPIKRAKHAAVPIMTPSDGGHCILAADAIFETLRPLIFSSRVFQKFDKDTWHILEKQLQTLEEEFTPSHQAPYFIKLDHMEKLVDRLNTGFAVFKSTPTKAIRNAKKDGFTVQNLKNELMYLGIVDLFPEIQDFANDVYEDVMKATKKEFLRTCDLFDAIEQCVLICVFNRFPMLKLFLHTQNACHRVPRLQCDHCSDNSNKDGVEKVESPKIEIQKAEVSDEVVEKMSGVILEENLEREGRAESLTTANKALQEQITQLQAQLDTHNKKILELKSANLRLSMSNDEKEKTIQNLLDRLTTLLSASGDSLEAEDTVDVKV